MTNPTDSTSLSPKFKNRYGREYTINLTLPVIDRLRSEMQIDIYRFETLTNLPSDPIPLCKLFWIVTQATEDLETFTNAMTMQSMDDASGVFILALCDVLPTRQADLLRESHLRHLEFMNAVYDDMEQKLGLSHLSA